MRSISIFWFELFIIDMSFRLGMSSLTEIFLSLILNNFVSLSDSAAFLSHQYINNSINISTITVMRIKIYGIIPIKPWKELLIIAGRIFVESLIAVGENNMKTPILQIKSKRMNGTILKTIDGTLMKYFWSSFGPQA